MLQQFNFVNAIGLVAAFGTTISFLPQAIKTIRTKDTSAISLPMYVLFTAGTVLWLAYGILDNAPPVVIGNFVTLVFASIILAFKIKYK
ncbi:MAG: SemiSWEET family sugar transporter [Mucilaginibacter sp.]